MNVLHARRASARSRKGSIIADQRGAVALEMPFVYGFLMFSLLLPLADVSIASFQYISGWQALRAFGQSIQYSPPPDVTNASSWKATATAKADPRFPISNFQLVCADNNSCSAANSALPGAKYYSYTTEVTLAPIVLQSVLCANSCTKTLSYSERFQ